MEDLEKLQIKANIDKLHTEATYLAVTIKVIKVRLLLQAIATGAAIVGVLV